MLAGVWLLQGEALRDLAAGLGRGAGGPRVGAPAPDFTLRDLDGNQVRLADLRGQKVVVNFWATWCPPCRSEMPDLDRVARESRGEGVVVLTVDQMESPDTVRGYLRELSLGLDPVLDGALLSPPLAGAIIRPPRRGLGGWPRPTKPFAPFHVLLSEGRVVRLRLDPRRYSCA